jgi:uncharacterized protein (TIGR02678 family)
MKEIEILLERFWIIKERDRDLYYMVKDAVPKIKDFLEEKLGYRLIVNSHLIKLEKVPGKAEDWMGIEEFETKMEYVIFCIVLGFLEDKSQGEQFVLSQLTEHILLHYDFPAAEKLDWTLYRHRKYLVNVMRFIIDIGFVVMDDGDHKEFMDSDESESLYQSTGISRYFMRSFFTSLDEFKTFEDFEKIEVNQWDQDNAKYRRHRVYRQLFMSPIVYSDGVEDQDYLYIKNYRNLISKDVDTVLQSSLHVHKNGAMILLDESKHRFKHVFPSSKGISDVVLFFNRLILEKMKEKENTLPKKEDETVTISESNFIKLASECKEKYGSGFSKEYRDMSIEKFSKEVREYMKGFRFLKHNKKNREIVLMPLVGKVKGFYPKEYKGED